jgi:hypothetical protein
MDWIHHSQGRDKWCVLASEEGPYFVELVSASWEWLQKFENMLLQGACLKRSGI